MNLSPGLSKAPQSQSPAEPFFQNRCEDAEAEVAGNGQQEAVQDDGPDSDGRPQVVVPDEVDVDHAEEVHCREAGQIGEKHPSEGAAPAFPDAPCQPCTGDEADQVAEGGLENIGGSAAFRKDRHACQAEGHIEGHCQCALPAAQKQSRQGGEEQLQGEGTDRNGDADKGPCRNQCGEQSEEYGFSCFSRMQHIFLYHFASIVAYISFTKFT